MDLGIPAASVDEVYQSIEDCGPLLSQIGVDERTRILINCLHTGSWFQFRGSSKFIIAKKGGRQGCRFGGKIFNLTYDKALREIRVELKRVGVCFTVYGSRGYPPFADCPPKYGKDIIDVTFVDDEAVIITAKHAADLLGKIPVVVRTIDRVFRKYGMSINFSKGKTELSTSCKGNGTVQAKRKLAERSTDGVPYVPVSVAGGNEIVQVHVVDSYKHLSSIICADTNLTPEARARASPAMAAFG